MASPPAAPDQEATLELTLEEAARGGQAARSPLVTAGTTRSTSRPAYATDSGSASPARVDRESPEAVPRATSFFCACGFKPHRRLRGDGRDLYVDLPVCASWEAALGATVEVPTLEGTSRVKVPPGSSSGQQGLQLEEDRGCPDPSDQHGDLFATVQGQDVVPKNLNKKERELFEELAEASSFDPRQGL